MRTFILNAHIRNNDFNDMFTMDDIEYPKRESGEIPDSIDGQSEEDEHCIVLRTEGFAVDEKADTEYEKTLRQFKEEYDNEPLLQSVDSVKDTYVLFIPKSAFASGAQCFEHMKVPEHGKKDKMLIPSYFIMAAMLAAVSMCEEKDELEVFWETLQNQEIKSSTIVAKLDTNSMTEMAGVQVAEESVLHVTTPVPVRRNIPLNKILSNELSSTKIASLARAHSIIGYRLFILDRKGGVFMKAWNRMLDRNDKLVDPKSSTYRAKFAQKPLYEIPPCELGKAFRSSHVDAFFADYLTSVGLTRMMETDCSLSALSVYRYFENAEHMSGDTPEETITFAQTAWSNYVLSEEGSGYQFSFPSGLNVYRLQAHKITPDFMTRYLPNYQALIVAPVVRESVMARGSMRIPMQGVDGLIPKIQYKSLHDENIARVRVGQEERFRVISLTQQKGMKQKEAEKQKRSWEDVQGAGMDWSAVQSTLSDPNFAYTPLEPQIKIDEILSDMSYSSHPKKAAGAHFQRAVATNEARRERGEPHLTLEQIREESVQLYFGRYNECNDPMVVSDANRSIRTYARREMKEFRWRLDHHRSFTRDLTPGDELLTKFFTAIGTFLGAVDKTGLGMLLLQIPLTAQDYHAMHPHVFMTGPPGASKSFLMKMMISMVLTTKLEGHDMPVGPVIEFGRFTNAAWNTITPFDASVLACHEVPDANFTSNAQISGGTNTTLKAMLAGETTRTLSYSKAEDGEDTRRKTDMGGGARPRSLGFVGNSNNPAIDSSENDAMPVDQAFMDRMFLCPVPPPVTTETRSVDTQTEAQRNQTEGEKKFMEYLRKIYHVLECFQQPLMDLIGEKILPEYNHEIPDKLFTAMVKHMSKSRDKSVARLNSRKKEQYSCLVNAIALWHGIAETYLAPHSDFYGLAPDVEAHYYEVYKNTGSITLNVSVTALGLMAPACQNPLQDMVVAAVVDYAISSERLFFAAEYTQYEVRRKKQMMTMAAYSGNSGFAASSTESTGPLNLSKQAKAQLFTEMADFDREEAESKATREKLEAQTQALLTKKKKALQKKGKDAQLESEIKILKRKLFEVRATSKEGLKGMAREVGQEESSHADRYMTKGIKLDPARVTTGDSPKEFVGRLSSYIMQKFNILIEGRMIRSILRGVRVRELKWELEKDPGLITGNVPTHAFVVNGTAMKTTSLAAVFGAHEDPVSKSQLITIRREILTGNHKVSNHLTALRAATTAVARTNVPRRYLTMMEIMECPQYCHAVVAYPTKAPATSVRQGARDIGESIVLGYMGEDLEERPDFVQFNSSSDFISVAGFDERLGRMEGMDSLQRFQYVKERLPMRKKAVALETAIAAGKMDGPFEYPDFFVRSKLAQESARLQVMKTAEAGYDLSKLANGNIKAPTGAVINKVVGEDGRIEIRVKTSNPAAARVEQKSRQRLLNSTPSTPRALAGSNRKMLPPTSSRPGCATETKDVGPSSAHAVKGKEEEQEEESNIRTAYDSFLPEPSEQDTDNEPEVSAIDHAACNAILDEILLSMQEEPLFRDIIPDPVTTPLRESTFTIVRPRRVRVGTAKMVPSYTTTCEGVRVCVPDFLPQPGCERYYDEVISNARAAGVESVVNYSEAPKVKVKDKYEDEDEEKADDRVLYRPSFADESPHKWDVVDVMQNLHRPRVRGDMPWVLPLVPTSEDWKKVAVCCGISVRMQTMENTNIRVRLAPKPRTVMIDGTVYISNPATAALLLAFWTIGRRIFGDAYPSEPFSPETILSMYREDYPSACPVDLVDPPTDPYSKKRSRSPAAPLAIGSGSDDDDDEEDDVNSSTSTSRPKKQKPLLPTI